MEPCADPLASVSRSPSQSCVHDSTVTLTWPEEMYLRRTKVEFEIQIEMDLKHPLQDQAGCMVRGIEVHGLRLDHDG